MPIHNIGRVVMLGDSLSDRATMYRRKFLKFFPMNWITGLDGISPLGRFTNGLAWSDHLSAKVADELIIQELKDQGMDDIDISDAVIHQDPRIQKVVRESYFLNDDLYVKYKGKVIIRTYDEGGLTAHDYSWAPSKSISRFFTRLLVSTLAAMRGKMLDYDREQGVSKEEKEKTLVVEWSGANDLITVNAKPSELEVDKALHERVENIKQLVKNGYCHFVLFNLPDLSLTPRYQAKNVGEQKNAHHCTMYFNEQLEKACKKLSKLYPHCTIDVFDVNKTLTTIYNDPEKFGFSKEKRAQAFTKSADFVIDQKKHISPATGYMFWDDIHPTADMHAWLADIFYQDFQKKYHFTLPEEDKKTEQFDMSEGGLEKRLFV